MTLDSMSRVIRTTDKRVESMAGMRLPPDWWSRPYEYAFAFDFAEPSHVVADMGCGWMYRPFKNALAEVVGMVYAVDANPELLRQPKPDNMEFVVSKLEHTPIEDAACDRVFCISVLEDIQDPAPALAEFARILKDDGLIVITMDIPYDDNRPCPKYPGMNLMRFVHAVYAAGLEFAGGVNVLKENVVYHGEWNLCVFRSVLRKQLNGLGEQKTKAGVLPLGLTAAVAV